MSRFCLKTITIVNLYYLHYAIKASCPLHFADNTCLLSIQSSVKQFNRTLKDLKHFAFWLNANNILNIAKTKVILFKPKNRQLDTALKVKLYIVIWGKNGTGLKIPWRWKSYILQPRETMIDTLPCSLSSFVCQTHSEILNLSNSNQILFTENFHYTLSFPDFFLIIETQYVSRCLVFTFSQLSIAEVIWGHVLFLPWLFLGWWG